MFPEPHSTKQREDGVGWALQTDAATLDATSAARARLGSAEAEAVCRAVACPVLVVHGDRDEIVPCDAGARVAELTGGTLVAVPGAGHGLPLRDPVRFTLLVAGFADSLAPPTPDAPDLDPRSAAGAGVRCSSPPRSGSATRCATSRSPRRCARTTPTCRSTGWPSTR